jgi:predicted phage baseplate assembly protein
VDHDEPLASNVPGLPALAYRVGTHGTFKARMLAALSAEPALRGLTTRADDDPSVALVDGWACVLDVLSFYQERIANEGFVRTATERSSLGYLGRALGYDLNPGVAASTYLTFSIDETPGAPSSVALAIGTKVQSIPAQDELPQLFETIEPIEARAAWNVLRPRSSAPGIPAARDRFFLQGTATQLKRGDALLAVKTNASGFTWDLRFIQSVDVVYPALPTLDPTAGYTQAVLNRPLSLALARSTPQLFALRQRAAVFGFNAPDWRAMSKDVKRSYDPDYDDDPNAEWPHFNVGYGLVSESAARTPEEGVPGIPTLPEPPTLPDVPSDPPPLDTLYLDAIYPKVREGGWLALGTTKAQQVYRITDVSDAAMVDFLLASKCTCVRLEGDTDQLTAAAFYRRLREIVVLTESEELQPAGQPLTEPVTGTRIVLDRVVDGLVAGQRVAIRGVDEAGVRQGQVLTLAKTSLVDGLTELRFTTAIQHVFTRASVTLSANVAAATHGESKTELLGSGNASQAFQRFALAQGPLTFAPAATPSGRASTLEVRVNGLLWQSVDTLLGRGAYDRVYVTRVADDGTAVVQFGDGTTGARLPTGADNVVATYRVGLGTAGQVEAEQLSLLMSRPLGLSAVSNSLPPSGAEDPESVQAARQNIPTTVLALDRIVSLQDFTDFARAFAGVAKAQATLIWSGQQRIIHLTVAGSDGTPILEGSALHSNLQTAMNAARHADRPVRIASYSARTFQLTARVLIDPAYLPSNVLAGVQTALRDQFSFERRDFGQAVTKGEVFATIQAVAGVVAVDLDSLYLTGKAPDLCSTLVARLAAWDSGEIRAAELITLDALGAELVEMV